MVSDLHAWNNTVVQTDTGKTLATFSGHWPACAAIIRISNPSFKSLGGDKTEDMIAECDLHEALGRVGHEYIRGICRKCGKEILL